ncbi:GGP4 [Scenedesmus sp. PABB004]|nr:GGP4 [Scenedesmus sp. PABB004]
MATRRVALLECEDAPKWAGYTESLWRAAVEEPGDEWRVWRACAGELPTADEAAACDAVIVGGSHYSAYEDHVWIQRLLELLPAYAASGARIYGCCFGAQILARALGGEVGPNPDGAFVLTLESVQPTPELARFEGLHAALQADLASGDGAAAAAAPLPADAAGAALAALSLSPPPGGDEARAAAAEQQAGAAAAPGGLRLIESHGDQVLALPPGAVRLATSPTAANELWAWGPNVLASQFHVEFDEPLVLQKIWATLRDAGRLSPEQAEASRRSLAGGGAQSARALRVIKHFLRHGAGDAARPPGSSAGGGGGRGDGGAGGAPGGDGGALGGGSAPADGAPPQQQQQQQQQPPGPGAAPPPGAAAAGEPLQPGLPPLRVPADAAAAAATRSSSWPSGLAGADAAPPHGSAAPSGASSPTAASEASWAGTASTASTVPFSVIAHQRRAAAREAELGEAAGRMVGDADAALQLRLRLSGLDLDTLTQLNAAAAEAYGGAAELAAALGQFVSDLGARQAAVREALCALPALDRQLRALEGTVSGLDRRSRELEARLGLGRGRGAYDYLAAAAGSLSRAGSSVTAAAGGGAGCLGGGALPRQ